MPTVGDSNRGKPQGDTMNTTEATTLEEMVTRDGEDRLVRTSDGWSWQTRGSAALFGPFTTMERTAADCERPLADFLCSHCGGTGERRYGRVLVRCQGCR